MTNGVTNLKDMSDIYGGVKTIIKTITDPFVIRSSPPALGNNSKQNKYIRSNAFVPFSFRQAWSASNISK